MHFCILVSLLFINVPSQSIICLFERIYIYSLYIIVNEIPNLGSSFLHAKSSIYVWRTGHEMSTFALLANWRSFADKNEPLPTHEMTSSFLLSRDDIGAECTRRKCARVCRQRIALTASVLLRHPVPPLEKVRATQKYNLLSLWIMRPVRSSDCMKRRRPRSHFKARLI